MVLNQLNGLIDGNNWLINSLLIGSSQSKRALNKWCGRLIGEKIANGFGGINWIFERRPISRSFECRPISERKRIRPFFSFRAINKSAATPPSARGGGFVPSFQQFLNPQRQGGIFTFFFFFFFFFFFHAVFNFFSFFSLFSFFILFVFCFSCFFGLTVRIYWRPAALANQHEAPVAKTRDFPRSLFFHSHRFYLGGIREKEKKQRKSTPVSSNNYRSSVLAGAILFDRFQTRVFSMMADSWIIIRRLIFWLF